MTIGTGLAVPVAPLFVRSPAHGGNFVPAGMAGPMRRAEPPADLDAKLALLAEQNRLDSLRRNGR
jgi:hypothetical protein